MAGNFAIANLPIGDNYILFCYLYELSVFADTLFLSNTEPSLDTSIEDYPIQPLANEPIKTTSATVARASPAPSAPPPAADSTTRLSSTSQSVPVSTAANRPGSHPPPPSGMDGANPYRMGVMGARKAAGGYVPVSGPPPQPISQPMMGAIPPSALSHMPPPAPPPSQQTLPVVTQVCI